MLLTFSLCLTHVFSYFSQVESEGSRSGSSLSLRNMTGGTTSTGGTHTSGTGGSGAQTSQSPSHGTNNSSGSSSSSHNRVQRSISATSSKPRRGSTGAQDPNASAAGTMSYERFRTEIVINFSPQHLILIRICLFLGPPPTAAPRVNNNISSNFKRQNTVDTATIKENTPRYSGSRPATATAASTKTPSSSGKFFLILKSYVFLRILMYLISYYRRDVTKEPRHYQIKYHVKCHRTCSSRPAGH